MPAGSLTWTCWDTPEHIAGVGPIYAAQLAVRKQEHRYARLWPGIPGVAEWVQPRLFPEPAPVEVCESIEAAYRLLAFTVRGTGPGVRAYHPYGYADAEGFAVIASAEALVHTHDIMTGLGLGFEPPTEVCQRLLARTFPEAESDDPWLGLLRATGRAVQPGGEPVTDWRWRAVPLAGQPG